MARQMVTLLRSGDGMRDRPGATMLASLRVWAPGLASVVSHKCCYTQCRPRSGTRCAGPPEPGPRRLPPTPSIPSDGPVHLSITASCDQPTLPTWHGSLLRKAVPAPAGSASLSPCHSLRGFAGGRAGRKTRAIFPRIIGGCLSVWTRIWSVWWQERHHI